MALYRERERLKKEYAESVKEQEKIGEPFQKKIDDLQQRIYNVQSQWNVAAHEAWNKTWRIRCELTKIEEQIKQELEKELEERFNEKPEE